MGLLNNLLTSIFGREALPAGLSEIRAAKKERNESRAKRSARAQQTGSLRWHLDGHGTVWANTRSEARARLKAILQELEDLSFSEKKVTRLPVGAKVVRALS